MFNFTYRKKSSLPNTLCKLQLLKKQYSKYRFFFRNVKSIKGIITQIDYLRYPQRQRASDYCSQNPLYIFSYELMIEVCRIICYNFFVAHQYPQRGGGACMEFFISFLVTVLGGVACHYIIKWLDGDDKSNNQPGGCFATIKEKKNPQMVLPYQSGDSFLLPTWTFYLFFAYWHYSICKNLFQYVCHKKLSLSGINQQWKFIKVFPNYGITF